jgi:hypothetical protein
MLPIALGEAIVAIEDRSGDFYSSPFLWGGRVRVGAIAGMGVLMRVGVFVGVNVFVRVGVFVGVGVNFDVAHDIASAVVTHN